MDEEHLEGPEALATFEVVVDLTDVFCREHLNEAIVC
jgi:hypothetical protein